MIGVESIEPKMPPLVMVKTPPSRSARVILPSRAALAASPIAFSMSAMPSVSQLRTTGTIRPFSVETAMPMS
jgi:hypothetical protein